MPSRPVNVSPIDALARLRATAARVQEFPAGLVIRTLLDDIADARGIALVGHIVAGWADRLATTLDDFPSAPSDSLSAIRGRMTAELAALRALQSQLDELHSPMVA